MTIREKLQKKIEKLIARRNEVEASLIAEDDKETRAALGETLKALKEDITEAEEMLAELDEPADDGAPADEAASDEARGFDVVGAMKGGKGAEARKADPHDTEEYRTAFMNFVCRNVPIPAEVRADATTSTADAGAVIPTTIMKEIIKELKSYGNLYNAVRKLNVQGGVEIPILSLKPTATWITADTSTSESDKQKLQANTKISFSYFGLECKVSQTLLVSVVTLDVFQSLFVELAVEAIVQAWDIAIIKGSGSGEPTGVTVDARVPSRNVITLTAEEFLDWSAWKKKVFGKMKKSYRNGNFYMAQSTFDGYIDGMVDSVGQPIGRVNYGIDGAETYRFGGKNVETVEDDIITGYDDAATGDIVAVFFKPTDYAINSNMEMRIVKWVDHDTNEVKNKVILIADGKLVDPNGVIIIKKGAAAT